MDDLKIRLFKNDIINYINSVDLPMEVKRLVLVDIYNQVSTQAETVIKAQLEEHKKGEQQIR